MQSPIMKLSLDKFFYLGVVPALFFQFAASIFYFVIAQDSAISALIYTATKIVMIVWPLFVVFYLGRSYMPVFQKVKSFFFPIVVGIFIFGFLLIANVFLADLLEPSTEIVKSRLAGYGLLDYFFVFSLAICTFNALFEEYFWRWFVFRGLNSKLNVYAAAVIGSAAFSAHHFVILSQIFDPLVTGVFGIAIFGAGLIFCALYKKTGSVFGSFFAHFAADAAIMLAIYQLIF